MYQRSREHEVSSREHVSSAAADLDAGRVTKDKELISDLSDSCRQITSLAASVYSGRAAALSLYGTLANFKLFSLVSVYFLVRRTSSFSKCFCYISKSIVTIYGSFSAQV